MCGHEERKVRREKERHVRERKKEKEEPRDRGSAKNSYSPVFNEIYAGFIIFNLLQKSLAGLCSYFY